MTPIKGTLSVLTAVLAVTVASAALARSAPASWPQFRMSGSNNVALDGTLSTTWKFVSGGPISSSPTLDGTTLFVDNNHGDLYALDVNNGNVLWVHHARNALMSAPIFYQGLVVVGEGDEMSLGSSPSTVYVGMGPSELIALDEQSGAIRWRTAVAGSAMPTPALIGDTLVHHNGAGWIVGLDPMKGTVKYARNIHSIASMTAVLPVGDDRFVTVGVLDNAAFEVHAKDGSVVWRTPFSAIGSGQGDCPPVFDGTRVMCDYMMPKPPAQYTIATSPAIEHAYALDVKTGAKLWDVPLETGVLPPRNEAAIPLYASGTVYLGSAIAPYMHAIDAPTGRLLWKSKTHGPVKGGLVLVDGDLYFGDLRGYLWAVDAKTGTVVGDEKMPSGFNVGSPIAVGKTLIIGSRTGSVYALPLSDIRTHHD